MTLTNKTLMTLLTGVLVAPLAANAEGTSMNTGIHSNSSVQSSFNAADADNSGTLTQEEYEVLADAQEDAGIDVASDFDDLDRNNDDVLTVAELDAQEMDGENVDDNY